MKRVYNILTSISLMVALACLSGCAVVEPLKAAQTVEQKAYVLYAEYTIAQGVAVRLVRDAAVPASVKSDISRAEAAAFPVAEQLADTAMVVTELREQYVVGATSQEKLESAVANLSNIYFAVKPRLEALILTVKANQAKGKQPT